LQRGLEGHRRAVGLEPDEAAVGGHRDLRGPRADPDLVRPTGDLDAVLREGRADPVLGAFAPLWRGHPRGERLWRHGLTVGPVPPLFPARAPTRSAGGLAQASYACGMGMKDRIAREAGTRAVPAVASGYVRTV